MMKQTLLYMFSLMLLIALPQAKAAFEFQNGDKIVYIGNSLADRMQHHGWLETLVQSELANKQLVFRNNGYCGDKVNDRPRNRGFMSAEKYLEHCKADVIFCFFGYNESFDAEGGIAKFKDAYSKMIDQYRGLKFNGKSEPRFVLFSPIAHEDLKSKDLPNGRGNNKRLTAYSNAIAEVAKSKNVMFVDLFNTSLELYGKGSPLTINGVHLSLEGNRQIAEVAATALLGKKVSANSRLQKLRSAVVDKNWHWFNRYRATDGNDVWGGRSGLKFVDNQSNFTVLQQELVQLDVLTANRDPNIWAIASGKSYTIDDSNMPAPIPVISNVGGKSKSSNASKEGSVKYLSAEETRAGLQVPEGYVVNTFASEEMFPELVNPVQMGVDAKGRVWAAAWKTYPKWEPGKVMDDRLLIFPDENGDGVADKSITFAKVHNPIGFEFWGNGVIVVSAPDIIYLEDTDGDDVADKEIRVMMGIDSADTHHTANNLIYGPDGGIYYQRGVFHVSNVESPWRSAQKSGASAMYRFNPRTYAFSHVANNSPNPHGTSFDYWGYHFATDGTGGRAYQVVPHERKFKMRQLVKKEVRPVPASEVLSSAHFPEDVQGDFLICNSIGFLGVKQYKLERNAESGEVNQKMIPTADGKGKPSIDFLVSTKDRNFRPTDLVFGSDGAAYVADWSNVIIGHMQHNIRDPNRDHKHGRIFRVTVKDRPLQKQVAIDGQPIARLLDVLKHPVDGVRQRARIELAARDTEEVMKATRKWITQFDARKKEDAHHLLEALWLHQQHNVKNSKLMTALLSSPEPHARRAAQTAQHYQFTFDETGGGAELKSQLDEKVEKEPSDFSKGIVNIYTVKEQMRYDIKEFTVKQGQEVTLTLVNDDYMPHNLLIIENGAAQEVATAAMMLGEKGFDMGFRPDSKKILWGTKMLDAGQRETIKFKVPKKGQYEFVCTFPGHWTLMRGIMKVN